MVTLRIKVNGKLFFSILRWSPGREVLIPSLSLSLSRARSLSLSLTFARALSHTRVRSALCSRKSPWHATIALHVMRSPSAGYALDTLFRNIVPKKLSLSLARSLTRSRTSLSFINTSCTTTLTWSRSFTSRPSKSVWGPVTSGLESVISADMRTVTACHRSMLWRMGSNKLSLPNQGSPW